MGGTNPAPPCSLTWASFDDRLSASDLESSEGGVRFAIDVNGIAIGSVSPFDFDNLACHAEIGIVTAQQVRDRGIGTSAISQMVEFGFVRRNLRRIHLQAIESNVAAIRACAKAGFIVEGHQRQHAWVLGATRTSS